MERATLVFLVGRVLVGPILKCIQKLIHCGDAQSISWLRILSCKDMFQDLNDRFEYISPDIILCAIQRNESNLEMLTSSSRPSVTSPNNLRPISSTLIASFLFNPTVHPSTKPSNPTFDPKPLATRTRRHILDVSPETHRLLPVILDVVSFIHIHTQLTQWLHRSMYSRLPNWPSVYN